jgi:hypothetical protein
MAKCLDCEKECKTVFDYRCNRKGKHCELYVIFDNSKPPVPTGFCLDCLLSFLRAEFKDLE